MSGYKRKDAYRKDGRTYRPRAAWKQEQEMKHKKRATKKKPYKLQIRLVNPEEVGNFARMCYGNGEWKDGWKRYKRFEDAYEAINMLQKNTLSVFNDKKLEYRIVKNGEVIR